MVWRYAIPSHAGEGWAILFLDDTGTFSAVSDYGNWAYRWPIAGLPKGVSFKQFLLTVGDDYLLHKIVGEAVEWNGEVTFKKIKHTILEFRRERMWSKEKTAEEWALLKEFAPFSTEYEFWDWSRETSFTDTADLAHWDPPTQAKMFVEKCWPKLKQRIAEEV